MSTTTTLDTEVNGEPAKVVALGGKIVVHKLGYRAQYAYPLRIVCPDEDIANALARWYGCETEVWP
jgi:hypothetical protein